MADRLTEQQQKAVETRGSVLISASAGAGKTKVLATHVVDEILSANADNRKGNVERLLIVTFTRLAAGEMRERIAKILREKDDGSAHARLQKLLLYKAEISTIDGFFGNFVRKNFRQANISPDFSMLSGAEEAKLRRKVLDRVMESHYALNSEDFKALVSVFGGEKQDENLFSAIDELYDKVMALPFPKVWLDSKLSLYDDASVWIGAICEEIKGNIQDCIKVYEKIVSLESLGKWNEEASKELAALRELNDALASKAWDKVCEVVRSYKFKNKPSGDERDLFRQQYFLVREYAEDYFSPADSKSTAALFALSEEDVINDLARLSPSVSAMYKITKEYIDGINREMERCGKYSFGVISQIALGLVVKEETYDYVTRRFEITDLAVQLQEKYDEVLVDEYQDTNDLQDTFFKAITGNDKIVPFFAVGDVKQSIYGFRNARPENFIERMNDKEQNIIRLNKNFRSRPGILDFTNFICKQLFSERIGGMEYTEKDALIAGRKSYLEKDENDVEVVFVNTNKISEQGTDTKVSSGEFVLSQARLAAQRIIRAVEEEKVSDGPEKIRRAEYGDIAVLLPKFSGVGTIYQRVFEEEGIPYVSRSDETFYRTVEVATIMALLKIIDNPYQDVELFAAMYSELFSFSPDELAQIRLCDRNSALYDAVKAMADSGNGKCEAFVSALERYRLIANDFPVHKLIWRIYTDTQYPDAVSCRPAGAAKRESLMSLYSSAVEYSERSDGGLYGFIQYANSAERNSSSSNEMPPCGNRVRIMTMHASKGLEFPICILAYPFEEKADRRGVFRFDTELGVATKIRDEKMTYESKTLMYYAVGMRNERRELSEKLRLMYVALTRAREKLVIYSAAPRDIKICASSFGDSVLPLHVGNMRTAANLLFAALSRHKSFDGALLPFSAEKLDSETDVDFSYNVTPVEKKTQDIDGEKFRTENEKGEEIRDVNGEIKGGDNNDVVIDCAELKKRFEFKYPRSHIPSKVSVTEIAKNKLYDSQSDEMFVSEFEAPKPKFMCDTAKGTERGTAIHKFLAVATFRTPVEENAAILLHEGSLSEEQAQVVIKEKKAIEEFYKSSLCDDILAATSVRKEENFVVRINASIFDPKATEGTVLLQGAMDLICEYEDGFIIVDYKTDRASEAELKNRYSDQLRYYAYAAEKCYGKKVKRICIWSTTLGKTIDIQR